MDSFVLAGGCFWCLDGVYRQIRGVSDVVSGFAGGTADDAEYYQVASGRTDHAECVQVIFDETIIPSETILDIFFLIHDPTTLNRQGADKGPQYRSAMFYANEPQKDLFTAAISRAQEHWDNPIVTTLEPLEGFYPADAEHQDYFAQNPANPYCSIVIQPKVLKARQAYASWLKES